MTGNENASLGASEDFVPADAQIDSHTTEGRPNEHRPAPSITEDKESPSWGIDDVRSTVSCEK